MGLSITPAMSVTVISTAKKLDLLPSTTQSDTPPMGVAIQNQNRTVNLEPD